MKKLFTIALILFASISFSQSNFTYEVTGDIMIENTGITTNKCYIKTVGTPSMVSDSVINYQAYVFSSHYASIIYFLEKETEYKWIKRPTQDTYEGMIRLVIRDTDVNEFTPYIGKFAVYESGQWKFYNRHQQPFGILELSNSSEVRGCYKLDALCFRDKIKDIIIDELGISNVTIIADPANNAK